MKDNIFLVAAIYLIGFVSCQPVSSKKEDTTYNIPKATLLFKAPLAEINVSVSKSIDNTSNYYYIHDDFKVTPNISILYELDVNDFEFIQCRFSKFGRYVFLVLPGDHIELICDSQKLITVGSNAQGHDYLHDNYIQNGLSYYDKYIEPHLKQAPFNYDSIWYSYEQLQLSYQDDLKKMEKSGSITPRFSSLLAKNLYYGLMDALPSIYSQWVVYNRKNYLIQDFQPSADDLRNMLLHLNRLRETPEAKCDDAKKMHYRLSTDFQLSYHFLDDETKKTLTEGYEDNCFGRFPYYLLASDSLQLRFFGGELINDLQKKTTNFNQEALLAYLSGKFPDSEYVAIIKQLMAQNKLEETNDEFRIIDTSPSSISELMQITGIKGKYAYIDLWATWCSPCTSEFLYNDHIHNLFAQYNNIVPVYISLDTDRKRWESAVKHFNLKGYNIMANRSLNEDIGKKVYRANEITLIPRYLLLDPVGNIVNDNLPRPSQSTMLKPILSSVLKQNQ